MAATQYGYVYIHGEVARLNSISSPALPMIGTEKPSPIRVETPRTIPSSTPKEAISSQDVVPSGTVSTGCPIWTPSSVTMAGTIEAVAEKLFTLSLTQCGTQAATVERRRSSELEARSTGSHCGGLTTAWSASASLLATQGFVVFGMKAAQKAAAKPMRTSARKRELCSFAYNLRTRCVCRGGMLGRCMGEVHGVAHAASRGRVGEGRRGRGSDGQCAWEAHGRRMGGAWNPGGESGSAHHRCVAGAWGTHGMRTGCAWRGCWRCMGGAWEARERCMRRVYGRCVGGAWEVRGQCTGCWGG